MATETAGATPYFAPSLRFIDTLGLAVAELARFGSTLRGPSS